MYDFVGLNKPEKICFKERRRVKYKYFVWNCQSKSSVNWKISCTVLGGTLAYRLAAPWWWGVAPVRCRAPHLLCWCDAIKQTAVKHSHLERRLGEGAVLLNCRSSFMVCFLREVKSKHVNPILWGRVAVRRCIKTKTCVCVCDLNCKQPRRPCPSF